ncbi:hypothetical protein LBMAG42_45010 [Deltaproteobacteria bacterium]|nr:hypothetical protein LBMAG42_45010 [Deltaproteobacteria bacterium]
MTFLLIILGCTPTCDEVCDKLVACENEGTERMSSDECKESCTAQHDLYDEWTDTQKRDAFDAELSCLYESECSDIEAGVCYEAEVWGF